MRAKTNKNITRRERVPSFLPAWLRTRIEVNVREMEALMAYAGQRLVPESRVLDAGAGEGRFKEYFTHTRYTAVDLAVGDDAWDYGQLNVLADLEQLPFADGSYDAVICTQVLEHVKRPQVVLREMARVLRPGGELYLTAPQSWYEHQQPHDYFRYTSFGLRYLFEQSGLTPVFVKPMGGYFWFLSFQLQRLHFWLWPPRPDEAPLARTARIITTLLIRVVTLLLLPLPLYYLDRLDKRKDQTLGYACHCVKE
ncbi:MAG TPA: class I SAM-dependent methyltransferase [Anaerolineae bacterium]|nr:class I SAM-dependent methyltransferase [Anaerolineae bacterium]